MPSSAVRRRNGANGRSATAGGSLGDALRNLQRYTQGESFDNQGGGRRPIRPEIQFETSVSSSVRGSDASIAQVKRNWFIPYAAMSMKGTSSSVQRPQGRLDHRPAGVGAKPGGCLHNAPSARCPARTRRSRCRRNIPTSKAFLHRHLLLQRDAAAVTRSQRLGLLILLFAFIVYVVVRVR